MKDPVIIATGQTSERANIQKWLEQNHTCPNTSQVLPHTGLTPNFVLRSLINQWYETNGLEIPERACDSSRGGKPNLLDALLEERGTVDEIVEHLRSGQIHLQRVAAAQLRSLAKQNTENRVCIAEAGAIPHLVSLLSNQDPETHEHAVTALLNLSIHERIKGTVVLAGAIPAIVKVFKYGSMGARENAAATLFSLSVVDENKLTIGALGAIPALVDLLKNGSVQGRKDAASALFNLLIYQGNKAKAVRAGVVDPVMNLLVDPSTGLLDEAVSILAVLATHQEGRKAIGKAFAVPALISLLQNSTPRTEENAAAILLALSLDNPSHLATAGRLGVKRHLVELANSGTERARRKAMTLLEQLAMVEWHRDAEWETSIPLTDFDWKEVAEPVMHLYTETTDGSFIGVKESALVWHHQDADPDFGYWQAKELLDHLESVLANEPVAVKIDQHMVEVKPQVVWKMVDLQKDTRNDDIKIMEDFVLKNPLDNDQESDIETQKKGKRIMLKPRNRSFQRKR